METKNKVAELGFDYDNPLHLKISRIFEYYFSSICPMIIENARGTIILVDYPDSYSEFIKKITAENRHDVKLYEYFIDQVRGELSSSDEGKRILTDIEDINSATRIMEKIIVTTEEEHDSSKIKSSIIDHACEQRFIHLSEIKFTVKEKIFNDINLIKFFLEKNKGGIPEPSVSIDDFPGQIKSEDEFLILYEKEQDVLSQIISFYSETLKSTSETEEYSRPINILKERIRSKDERYVNYFLSNTKNEEIINYIRKGDYDEEVVEYYINDICKRAALEYTKNKISEFNIDLQLLGMSYNFIEERYINVNNLDETYQRNIFVLTVADIILRIFKITPPELLEMMSSEDEIIHIWNNIHTEEMVKKDFLSRMTSTEKIEEYKKMVTDYVFTIETEISLEPPFMGPFMMLIKKYIRRKRSLIMKALDKPRSVTFKAVPTTTYFTDNLYPYVPRTRGNIITHAPLMYKMLNIWKGTAQIYTTLYGQKYVYTYIQDLLSLLSSTKYDPKSENLTRYNRMIQEIVGLQPVVYRRIIPEGYDQTQEDASLAINEFARTLCMAPVSDVQLVLWRYIKLPNAVRNKINAVPVNGYIGFKRASACSQFKETACRISGTQQQTTGEHVLFKIFVDKKRVLNLGELNLNEKEMIVPPLTVFKKMDKENHWVTSTNEENQTCLLTNFHPFYLKVFSNFNWDLERFEPSITELSVEWF